MDLALKYAPLAGFSTALVGLVALIFAYTQIRIHRQNEAKRQFLNFLDECIKYPQLAEGKISAQDADSMARYRWFLFKLLMCSESIMEVFPKDQAWLNAVMENVSPHVDFICKQIDLSCYSLQMREEIAAMANGNPRNRPLLKDLRS